ncbi:MAG: hypothetical protein M1138_00875 [Candidatus Thermoplasmatota archaeon]|nr:hypothetical protein [Candidatus Thermoplasmatota archaeon]
MSEFKKTDLIGYTGMAFTAVSLLILGNLSYIGWVVAITGSIIWVAYAVILKLYPILGINLILIAIDVRGLLIWTGVH